MTKRRSGCYFQFGSFLVNFGWTRRAANRKTSTQQDSGVFGPSHTLLLKPMETQQTQARIDFERVKEAIHYLHENYHHQPRLDEVSDAVNVSPHHFQRIFSAWAGTSPKKFLQFISLGHAKRLLREEQSSLFEAAYRTGLSGSSRLHDLFISIEAMTPRSTRTVDLAWTFLTALHRGPLAR